MCRCIFPSPTSSENTFEESFKCAKYLRAILVITYLFFYGCDCSDSTLTNMNEWIHEETKVMCYITHQKGKVLLRYNKKKTVYFKHIIPWYRGFVQWDETWITAFLWKEKNHSSFTKMGFDFCQYQQQCVLTVSLWHSKAAQLSAAKQLHSSKHTDWLWSQGTSAALVSIKHVRILK